MAQNHNAQQEDRHSGNSIEVRTLVLAAIAAVVAAVVTSFFWERGTLISTALTPVIVTLTQEFLRRPAERVSATARRVAPSPTRGVTALSGVGVRGAPDTRRFDESRLRDQELGAYVSSGREGNGGAPVGGTAVAAPPPPFDDTRSYDSARSSGSSAGDGSDTAPAVAAGRPPERRVYGRRRFRWKVALLTGGAAFLIAAVALTASELALGGSVGGDGRTSLFGGGDRAGQTADGAGDEDSSTDGETEEDAPSSSSEGAPAPDEESQSFSTPEEQPAPEEEPVEPADPVPAEPVPAEPSVPSQ